MMRARFIDVNADVGEGAADDDWRRDALIMCHVSSVSIACGAHAGDEATAREAIREAQRCGCAIGAHPSYPDRAGFGRQQLSMPLPELRSSVAVQLEWLNAIAKREGASIRHVKPHGALYHVASVDHDVARMLGEVVLEADAGWSLVGAFGSPALHWWRDMGLRVQTEGFADRVYEPDGRLRSRTHPDALITDPKVAAFQSLSIACEGFVKARDGTRVALECDSICIHSDTPQALEIARAVRSALSQAGLVIRAVASG